MKSLVCEMCQSNDLVKQDGYYVCQHCGTKYTVEEAKKLMIEGKVDVSGSTVTIDKSKEADNMRVLARRSFDEGNHADAASYYEKILLSDPNDIEASLYSAYGKAYACKIGEIADYLTSTGNRTISILKTIQAENIELSEDFSLEKIILEFNKVQRFLRKALFDYLMNNIGSADTSLVNRGGAAHKSACYSVADLLVNEYQNTDLAVEVYLGYRSVYNASAKDYEEVSNRIYLLKPELKEQEEIKKNVHAEKNGCYVATAVYGSYDCPQVWTLRRFRDNTLAETWYGRAFIHTYYAISPTLVKWFGKSKWFKNLWKPTLDRMVETLNSKGVENTPYNDREW